MKNRECLNESSSFFFQLFRKDKEVKKKLVQSYKLMLDFYGIYLKDDSTGEVARASNWKDRFKNLNRFLLSYFFFPTCCISFDVVSRLLGPYNSYIVFPLILQTYT